MADSSQKKSELPITPTCICIREWNSKKPSRSDPNYTEKTSEWLIEGFILHGEHLQSRPGHNQHIAIERGLILSALHHFLSDVNEVLTNLHTIPNSTILANYNPTLHPVCLRQVYGLLKICLQSLLEIIELTVGICCPLPPIVLSLILKFHHDQLEVLKNLTEIVQS